MGRPRHSRITPARVAAAVAVLVVAGIVAFRALDRGPHFEPRGSVHLSSCTLPGLVTAECGHLLVDEAPGDRGGDHRRISLRIAVIPAARQPAVGALFYLDGGPGGAATTEAAAVQNVFGKIAEFRDLVLIDQRGTGGSHPLACPPGHVAADVADAVARYVRRCFAHLDGDPRDYTTAVAADDLEAARRALGYGRIDLYGGSYGATLAQVYLLRHPRSVRSAILDGGSLLGVPVYERAPRNAERALRLQLARCAASAPCRRRFPATRRELDVLLARPPRHTHLVGGSQLVLRPADVASTVQALSLTPDGAALIPALVHEAMRGDYEPLAEEFSTRVGRGLDARERLAMSLVITCSEPWARFDPAATRRLGAGSYFAAAAVAHARLFERVCREVPRGFVPRGSEAPPHSHVPVLIVAGAADPQDPAANMRGWRRSFPNGRLVIVPGAAHGAIAVGCMPLVAARFVARASVDGIAAGCARAVAPPPFAPVA
jgi:pimeloyl-ACP methyl ester carboxylesterase